jgi:hypothetical protein
LGADTFSYSGVLESTGLGHDVINGFHVASDRFDLNVAVTGVDARVAAGQLDVATFHHDLRAALTSSTLAANHAVLFTPDSGSEAGNVYVIVDANGVAGYQVDQDFVFQVDGGHHMSALSAADFI